MEQALTFIYQFFNYSILVYAVAISLSYLGLSLISYFALRNHLRRNSFINFRSILSSPLSPPVSLIAPAFNEESNIVDNVRSLLSIHYPKYEVVIVNDGSKDSSLQKLVEAFHLEAVSFAVNYKIACKEIKAIYKSRNPAYRNLIVVDKVNGGKADALNSGINIASGKYIACIDVDCVLEPDSLLRMVKPFMDESKTKVIASGGVIRIANSCRIENGRLIEIRLPEQLLPRFQVLEYIRAFLLGRMAWGRMNGLLLISGAFGLFDKEIVIACGGYDHKTVGEDMELVVRMRSYMTSFKQKYKVTFIPDPLCWTEAPYNYKILGRQRNRWTRGTIETLRFHKKMFFNPSFGILGLVSYPYWFFFEWLAPLIEFCGVLYCLLLAAFGDLSLYIFLLLLGCVYTFAMVVSTFAIWVDQQTYRQYREPFAHTRLFVTALLEPLWFHPFVVWHAVRGNIDYMRGKKAWGTMTRAGFAAAQKGKK